LRDNRSRHRAENVPDLPHEFRRRKSCRSA
jgi:hypothetical protein